MGNKLLKTSCLGYSKDLMDEPMTQKTSSPHSSTPSASSLSDKGSISKLAATNHTNQHHYVAMATTPTDCTFSKPTPYSLPCQPPETTISEVDVDADVDVASTSSSSPPSCGYKALTPCPPRECIKVLFLDVDGVLNTPSTAWDSTRNGIEDRLLGFLRLIVERTHCKIVLSTAWRLHSAYKTMLLQQLEMRAAIDVSEIVIGCTPSIPNCYRATEISMFIHRYNSNLNHKYYINNFAVLDDLPLDKYPHSLFLDGHFVHTERTVGLSILNVVDCIQILNSQQSVPYQKQLKYFKRAATQ